MERPKTNSADPKPVDIAEVQSPDINTVEGRDEILRRAVEEERRYLRLTPGQLATLQAAKEDEERYSHG